MKDSRALVSEIGRLKNEVARLRGVLYGIRNMAVDAEYVSGDYRAEIIARTRRALGKEHINAK